MFVIIIAKGCDFDLFTVGVVGGYGFVMSFCNSIEKCLTMWANCGPIASSCYYAPGGGGVPIP